MCVKDDAHGEEGIGAMKRSVGVTRDDFERIQGVQLIVGIVQ